jgi:hypothetical protein
VGVPSWSPAPPPPRSASSPPPPSWSGSSARAGLEQFGRLLRRHCRRTSLLPCHLRPVGVIGRLRFRHLRDIAMKPVADGCLRHAVTACRRQPPLHLLLSGSPSASLPCTSTASTASAASAVQLPSLPSLSSSSSWDERPPSGCPGFQASILMGDGRQRHLSLQLQSHAMLRMDLEPWISTQLHSDQDRRTHVQ